MYCSNPKCSFNRSYNIPFNLLCPECNHKLQYKIIAVDFDNTLETGGWPEIGEPRMEVIELVKKEQRFGSKIILWTCREGEFLQDAVDWCEKFGIKFDAVNDNIPEVIESFGGVSSRKILATEYWDDRARKF